MEAIKVQAHTGPDGMLRLEVPVGVKDAAVEVVVVVVNPMDHPQSANDLGWPPGFFEETYGVLAHDPMERPSQGDYEIRDEIE